MARQLWVKGAGRISGPFSSEQLRQAAAKGKLNPEYEISTDRKKWVPARRVKGLRFSTVETDDPDARATGGTSGFGLPSLLELAQQEENEARKHAAIAACTPFKCPHCDKSLRPKPRLIGKRVRCPACGVGFSVPALTSVESGPPSVSGALQAYSNEPIPPNWATFGSPKLLFRISYPADWNLDTGEQLLLRPPISEAIWETSTNCIWALAMTLNVAQCHELFKEDELFNRMKKQLASMYDKWDFTLTYAEPGQFRGHFAAFFRFLFERAAMKWETALLWQRVHDKLFWFDAVGLVKHMAAHQEVLHRVLAAFMAYESIEAYEADKPTGTATCSFDAFPEDETVGILFAINSIESACYGRVVQREFFRLVDLKQIAYTSIAVGDLLPDAQFFCVRLDTQSAEAAHYLRRVFGEGCRAAGIAPKARRFMSGQVLKNERLVDKGVVTPDGEYVGDNWY